MEAKDGFFMIEGYAPYPGVIEPCLGVRTTGCDGMVESAKVVVF